MKFKSFIIALVAMGGAVSAARAGSTVNPNVPAIGGKLNSPPIQSNFQATFSDINNILGKYASRTAPTNPTNFQEWADLTTSPVAVFKYWNAGTATWIPYASINIITGAYAPFSTSSGFLGTAPIVATVSGGVLTYSLSADANFATVSGKLAFASTANGNLLANCSGASGEPGPCTWSAFANQAIGNADGLIPYRTGGVWGTALTGVNGHTIPFLDGTNTWSKLQTIYPGTATLRAALAGTLLRTAQLDGTASVIQQDTFGAAGAFTCMRSDGTAAVSTTLAANDLICSFGAHGYDGVANSSVAAAFRLYASQGWTSAAHGTYARVATTANGALTPTDQFGVEQDGGITAPPTVTGGSKGQGTFNAGIGYYVAGQPFNFSNLAGQATLAQIGGLGTGVATALGVNVGSAGAPVVNGGALGSPSSAGTLPAFALGGTISGGGNQVNNVVIGTSTVNGATMAGTTSFTGSVAGLVLNAGSSGNALRVGSTTITGLSGTQPVLATAVPGTLTSGNCVQAAADGSLTSTGSPCGTGSSGPAGVASINGLTGTAGVTGGPGVTVSTSSPNINIALATFAATNAALQATATTAAPYVIRLDFASGNGAPSLVYLPSSTACSLNSGAGDNGSQVPSFDSKCWIAQFPTSGVDIREFGCKADGTTDCNAALIAAAAYVVANGGAVIIPDATVRSSAALTFGAAKVRGAAPITPANPPSGPHIQCDITVTTTCAAFGVSGATSAGGNAEDLIVSFASGTPTTGSQAIVFQGLNSHCNNLMAYNAYDAFYFTNGLSAHCNNLYTWNVTDQHVVDNGFPELYINQSRFGLNGPGDQASSVSFIGLTGSDPNTVFCTNCQFNLGGKSPSHLVNYFNLTSETNGIVHIENSTIDMSIGNCTSLIKTDGTSFVDRLQISNSAVNATQCTLIDQSSQAIAPVSLQITNNTLLALSSLSIDTGTRVSSFVFDISHNSQIVGNVTLNSGAGNGTNGGQGIFNDNKLDNNLTISSTAPWSNLTMLGNHITGTYTDTAKGTIHADGPVQTAVPTLMIGSTAASTSGAGRVQRMPDGSVLYKFGLTVSSLNGGTGSLSVTGSPYTCQANDGLSGGFGNPGTVSLGTPAGTLVGLTGAPVAVMNQASATVLLDQASATGYTALNNSNIQVGTIISAKVGCLPN